MRGLGQFSNLYAAGFQGNNGRISPIIPTSSGIQSPVRFTIPGVHVKPVTFLSNNRPKE
jgi:hypothetical protein